MKQIKWIWIKTIQEANATHRLLKIAMKCTKVCQVEPRMGKLLRCKRGKEARSGAGVSTRKSHEVMKGCGSGLTG